ncbi:viroplasmin family protein [Aerococcus viridans]|uniref:ribonuclease H1 domain-containing protein n=1 Tax=Aerococcus TaxID=1375 RepID=UPI003AA8C988
MAKFYAVKKGKTPGIYKTWPDCQKQVKGFSGAVYKSFASLEEAEAFMGNGSQPLSKTSQGEEIRWLTKDGKNGQVDADTMSVYVDGSFDKKSGYFGYGGVVLFQDTIKTYKGGRNTEGLAKMRNVAGEIIAAMHAVKIAQKSGAKNVVIYHDYMGIAEWALKSWQAKNDYTKEYQDYMQEQAKNLAIGFVKIAAHTGNQYNEDADQLAKDGIRQAKSANK